jgi:hypothetical protein
VLPDVLVEDVAPDADEGAGGHQGSADAASCVVCVTPAMLVVSVAVGGATPVAIPSLTGTGAVVPLSVTSTVAPVGMSATNTLPSVWYGAAPPTATRPDCSASAVELQTTGPKAE